MPFMTWVKTPDGYKPVEITDEEMVAQNTVKRAEREKMERIREQLEIVNDKNFDRIKDSIPVPQVEPVNCKDCDDTVCCERGKDKLAYCPRCFEKKGEENGI